MARARSHLVPGLLLLAGLMTILCSKLLGFAQIMGKGAGVVNRKLTKAPNLHPRGGQPKNPIEDPLEEDEPEELPPMELPPYRAPYRVSLGQLGQAKLSDHNLEYIERKMLHALENFEDHIQDVQIHVSHDPHHHKPVEAPGSKKTKNQVKQVQTDEYDMDAPTVQEVVKSKSGTKQLSAPFRVDVRIDMKEGGKPVIVGKHAQHGMASLIEAVDHTYDCLKTSMGKEKSRLMAAWRKKKDAEEMGHPWEEEFGSAGLEEYEAKLDAEAEKSYAS